MISVIVPACNVAATLRECLHALGSQDGFTLGEDYEVILVDDGSHDETSSIGRQMGVQVISQENAGPAAARNAGARAARGDILAFTDADCAPLPNWLQELIAPFHDSQVIGVKGAYLSRQKELVTRFVQLEYEYKYLRMQRFDQIDFIDTYSAAYRKAAFLENGGFDPIFPTPSVEDQEFSFRLARKGYRLVFAPAAQVFHRHDRSVWEYIRRKWGIGYWKAVLLNWLPEKFLSDSHTSPSQRWQIMLLFLGLAMVCLGVISIWFLAAGLFSFAGFFLTTIPFLTFVVRKNVKLLLPSLGMLVVRAGALGLGLLVGFFLPPRLKKRLHSGPTLVEGALKRLGDLLGASLALIVFSPLLAFSALLIRITSPGACLFSQTRAGQNGKPFQIHKLRTMQLEAEQELNHLINVDKLAEPVYKIKDDPRVTSVGRFLRRWSIDELPQLWNVIRGEMSLVGPRPEETWLVDRYTDAQRQRLAIKPGLTGPMQVSGRGLLTFNERLELELEYIREYSLWKDIWIILRSIPAVILGKGAY